MSLPFFRHFEIHKSLIHIENYKLMIAIILIQYLVTDNFTDLS